MFIYILNILNDNNRINNISKYSSLEIINDTNYISQLGGIRKDLDNASISDRLRAIFKIFDKYNLSSNDNICIMNKLIMNKQNLWILEKIYTEIFWNRNEQAMYTFSINPPIKKINAL